MNMTLYDGILGILPELSIRNQKFPIISIEYFQLPSFSANCNLFPYMSMYFYN